LDIPRHAAVREAHVEMDLGAWHERVGSLELLQRLCVLTLVDEAHSFDEIGLRFGAWILGGAKRRSWDGQSSQCRQQREEPATGP
jgi:hypothetical protein